MYNLKKIIIMGKYDLTDTRGLETIVMQTEGMRIVSLLYLNDTGSIPDKKSLISEIMGELYADQFDKDDIKIKVKEVINGEDCMCKIAAFLEKRWDSDTLVYFYDADDDCYDYLNNLLINTNNDIYLTDYHDMFIDKKDTDNDIYDIMKNNNLKIENLIKDNKISMVYFLSGLVEKLFSK